jgi:PAS domain S-box-containing protein
VATPPPDPSLRLAAIVESSDDAIVSKDLNGTITSWNHGAELVFGYSPEEAVGRSITMLIPPERLSEEDMVLSKIRRGERVEHFETIRRRKDGRLINVSVTVSPIRDPDGTIVGASKIARNITDRVEIESRLAHLQQRLLGLAVASASILGSPDVDAVLSGAIALARDTFAADAYAVWRIEDGSWRIVRSFGVSQEFAERVIAPETRNAAPPNVPFDSPIIYEDVYAAPALANLRDAYEREGIKSMVVFPLVIRGERCGTMVFYSHEPRTFSDDDVQVGTALSNLVAASLTTAELYDEQRLARESADRARARATFLSEAGTALSASLDYQTTLRAVARLAVPTIADWCAVDIAGDDGKLQRVAVAHVDPAKVKLAMELEEKYPADPASRGGAHEVLRTGRATYMAKIPRELIAASAKDEEHRRLLDSLELNSYMCVPMLAQGKTFGVITFVYAESCREYSEADLTFARELAGRASLAVENARSYERATQASQLKDEFLATLSHELRTPLNSVLGYARMMRSGLLPEDKTKHAIDVIERNGTALKQIIEDVLDVSRIVAGRLRLNVEAVDVPQILKDSVATVMPAADAKGLRIETVIDPSASPVSGDRDRLQQIVWNLLSNAIKFTPRGGKVQVRLSAVNSHIEVAVCDTGRGISPEFLPHVFERFRQSDATFSREQGGLGLGLAIAKELAELHGGTVRAASDGPGLGATFTLMLPRMIVHAPRNVADHREHPHRDGPAPQLDPVPRLDGLHVVAVDDEFDSLNLLTAALEAAGASVVTFSSAAAALEGIRKHRPDVVIADIGMPGMDGLQFIRQLRHMEGPAGRTPAAALTAYARSQDRVTSLAAGFQMHLVKPVDPLELVIAVAALAERNH